MHVQFFLALLLLPGLLLLPACSTAEPITPTVTPTFAPPELLQPTPIPLTPTPTLAPHTGTPAPPTETPPPPIAVAKIVLKARAGPSVSYPEVGKIKNGESRVIEGKSEDGKWWQVELNGQLVWIPAELTEVLGGINAVPVVRVAPAAAPTAAPTRPPRPGAPTPLPTPTLQVPPANGHIYFAVRHEDGSLGIAWFNPATRESASFVNLGPAPGDFTQSTNASPLDWSERAGKLAFVFNTGSQDKLLIVDAVGNYRPPLASHQAILSPRWTADGQRIYFIGYDNNFASQKIYSVAADGIGTHECFAARPGEQLRGLAVSSRGEIAFISDWSGRKELWKLDSACGNPTQLTHDNAEASAPAFSPDGTRLVYVSNKRNPAEHRIYMLPAAGGAAVELGPDEAFAPAFSPDGYWIAFARNLEVYIMDITGGNVQPLTPGDRPTWAP